MITRLVKLTIDPERVEEFKTHFDQVKVRIRQFKGCEHLELLEDKEKPGVLFTISMWDSEINFDKYRNSELFISTWKTVKPLFIAKADAWSLVKLSHV